MSVSVGSVWRPVHGSGGKVVVRGKSGTQATVEPWPWRARQVVKASRLNLTADGAGIVGYAATGETG